MTSEFRKVERIPVENARAISNLEVHVQNYLDRTYAGRCYEGAYILSVRAEHVDNVYPLCIIGVDSPNNAYIDLSVVFLGYKIAPDTILLDGTIAQIPAGRDAMIVNFSRQVGAFTVRITIPHLIEAESKFEVGQKLAMRVLKPKYEPMRPAIACSGTPIQPVAGPIGNFDLANADLPRVKELFKKVKDVGREHFDRLKASPGYAAKCQAYSDSAWLKRDATARTTVETRVLDLMESKPVEGTVFYYDAADIAHLRFYTLPPTGITGKKVTPLTVAALLNNVLENLINFRSFDEPA